MKFHHGWAFPDVDEFMANEMKPGGKYQAGHLEAALRHVTDWSIAVDGGAHVGTWTQTLRERFARVIALEPSADTLEALLRNQQTFAWTNVEVKGIALGERPGFVSMALDEKGQRLKNTGARFAKAGGEIPVETIDSWHLPSLGLLKLDVEGSEPMALRGAVETLTRCRPIVIYEDKFLWRRMGEPRDAAETVMRRVGYRLLESVKCDRVWGPQ